MTVEEMETPALEPLLIIHYKNPEGGLGFWVRG
jgi:hypothetical protein